MPTQDRIGREQATDLGQQAITECLALPSQPAALVIVQQNSPSLEFLEYCHLSLQELDLLLLPAIQPSSQPRLTAKAEVRYACLKPPRHILVFLVAK